MWLFTQYGFYSAVCARQGDGRRDRPVDPDRVMVRVRRREHLERLMRRFPDLLGDADIRAFVGSDYPFRIFVAKPTWVEAVRQMTEEVAYDDFKSEVARVLNGEDDDYEHALHAVWDVMYEIQQD